MKIHLTLLVIALALSTQAQKKTAFSFFDANGNACEAEDAAFLGCFDKLGDTAYQWRYYNFSGPLIRVETYKDGQLSVPHGDFIYYNSAGKIDSAGSFRDGKKHGKWFFYTDAATVWQRKKYDNGALLETKDADALDLEYAQNKGPDTLKKVEDEASFRGGDAGWAKYVQRKLPLPARARKLNAGGTVVAEFIVGKDGSVGSVRLIQSVEYSIDDALTEVIRRSPKWKPAIQNGKPVKAYRRQPITIQF